LAENPSLKRAPGGFSAVIEPGAHLPDVKNMNPEQLTAAKEKIEAFKEVAGLKREVEAVKAVHDRLLALANREDVPAAEKIVIASIVHQLQKYIWSRLEEIESRCFEIRRGTPFEVRVH